MIREGKNENFNYFLETSVKAVKTHDGAYVVVVYLRKLIFFGQTPKNFVLGKIHNLPNF